MSVKQTPRRHKMSDTDTEVRETVKEKRARLAAEAAQNGETGATGEADKTTKRRIPDVSDVTLDAINGAALGSADLIAASAPVRERSDQQKAMDAVATRAYEAWVKAEKPGTWGKMPVVTYFLDAEELPKFRYLIRRACEFVEPVEGSPGVRVRFGNEFTLREDMAAKIGKPDFAGKTVLAWAAVDKRPRETEKDTDNE
jgi:hypothetical protein